MFSQWRWWVRARQAPAPCPLRSRPRPSRRKPMEARRRRPWLIESVYCFSGTELVEELQRHPVKLGVATSVRRELWGKTEVYSHPNNPELTVSDEQRRLLA